MKTNSTVIVIGNKIFLNPTSVAGVLGTMALVLMLASVAGQLAPYFTGRSEPVVFLSIDGEQNLPAFFSVLLILVATLLLAVIAVFKKAQGASYAFYWALLSLGFLFMAVDEATSIHEKLNGPMRRLLGDERPAIFHFAWLLPGIVFVLAIGLLFLRFLLHLPAKTRLLFFMAASLYLGGAIVLELIGSYYAFTYGIRSWPLIVSGHIEESLEMAGVIVFIFALLQYMAEIYGEMRFEFDNSRILHDRHYSGRLKATAVSLHPDSATSSRPGNLV